MKEGDCRFASSTVLKIKVIQNLIEAPTLLFTYQSFVKSRGNLNGQHSFGNLTFIIKKNEKINY